MDMLLFLIQSFFYDALLLASVAWIMRKKIPPPTFLLALCASVVFSFVAFVVAPFFLLFVPIATVKIAFSPAPMKIYALGVVYFYTLSACLSGIWHMLRYFVDFSRLSVGLFLTLSAAFSFVFALLFMLKTYFLKRHYVLGDLEHQVEFYCGEASATGIGFVDTGNELTDEVSAHPVMLVPQCKAAAIVELLKDGAIKTWEIGYSVVDDETRSLTAFRPTLLLVDGVIVKDVVVGLCDKPFGKYDFLLQPDITAGL